MKVVVRNEPVKNPLFRTEKSSFHCAIIDTKLLVMTLSFVRVQQYG